MAELKSPVVEGMIDQEHVIYVEPRVVVSPFRPRSVSEWQEVKQ